jgi:hypothetical protein
MPAPGKTDKGWSNAAEKVGSGRVLRSGVAGVAPSANLAPQ